MAGIPTAEATALLALRFNGSPYTPPAALYCQLHTGDPGPAGVTNVAANSARKSIAFGAASAGSVASNTAQSWTSVPASETYSYVSIWDAVTGGACRQSGPLTSPVSVSSGDTYNQAVGAVVINLS